MKKVIGLVGLPGSGKNEVAIYLKQKGFGYVSLSDTLRDILSYLEVVNKRKEMEDIGDILRENLGSEVLARGTKLQIDKIKSDKIVVDGIRNPAELEFLRQELAAYIVGVTMPDEKMFEIIKKRGRPGDPQNREEFKRMIDRELGNDKKESGLQLRKCLEASDTVIDNRSTIEDLHRKIDEILS